MTPNKKNIQKINYDFELRTKFPNGFECFQFLNPDIFDYYVVFFDAEEGGPWNNSASWIARYCNVNPTGNFIVMRKKWINQEEHTIDMDITPQELNKIIQKQC